MIKLGVNTILFKEFDFKTAVKHIALAGYDGVEISAIQGNCEHLELSRWRDQAIELKKIIADYGLEFLSMEVSSLAEERLLLAFEAGAEIGIPIINVAPGGKPEVHEDLQRSIETIAIMSEKAASYGVALCVKAHAGHSIYNSPTLFRALKEIDSLGFGIDMDPSHFYRANENPEEVLPHIISRVKHVHIRDCKDRDNGGSIQDQTCGRGNIDLMTFCNELVRGGYSGPISLEIIGSGGRSLTEVSTVCAESYGYLNACLKSLKVR